MNTFDDINTFDERGAAACPHRSAVAAEMLRRPREDALPEALITQGRYRDEGCDLFAACLSCPLPQCRYDVAGGARAMLNRVRDDEIRYLRRELAVPLDEIARRFRISRRTVFRALRAARKGSPGTGGEGPMNGLGANGAHR
jgi:hypothetical protein